MEFQLPNTAGGSQDWRDRRLLKQRDAGREFREKGTQISDKMKI